MKIRRIFTAVFLTICMLASNVSPVFAVPPTPSSFWGSVTINGANVPAGTIVSAWINGVQYSQAVVNIYDGVTYYGLDVSGEDPQTPGLQGGVEGDTIVFKIGDLTADQTGVWHTGTNVNINLTAMQSFPPVITEGASINRTMSEDGVPTAFGLTLNATDVNGDNITWSVSTPAGNGSASASGTGASKVISYTPNANYNGSDSFIVQASDGTGSDTITVNVTIEPVNDTPVASSQSVSTLENVAKNITLVANDIDGDPLSYILGTPSHGTLSGTAPNITYTPNANYSGSDSFTFKVNDNNVDSNTATVSITVDLVNVPPTCSLVGLTTNEDTTGSVALSCTDGDTDLLTYSIVGVPSHGTASVVSGLLQYIPAANYGGPDTFTYRAFDGLVYSNTATVNVTVTPVNDAPVANPQSLTTNEDTALPITLTGSDIEGSGLTYTVTVIPQHGTLAGSGANRTYTPDANYFGSDSFTFKVNDGSLDSAPAVIGITVTSVNDGPVAVADSYSTPEDTALNVSAPGVLGNDTDVDGDSLTAIKVSNPTSGTVTLNATGSFTYTPNAFFNGPDSFTYKVNDTHTDGNTVTVTINVSSVNNAPICSPVSLTTAEDTNGQANPSCTDADGNSMTYSIETQPSHGTASVIADKLVYAPFANYFGPDSFTYKASDSSLASAPATVTVTVTSVNDLPTISDITNKSTNEDTATGTIPFTVGDVETSANSLTVSATSSNTTLVPNVNITLGGTGASRTIDISPALNQSGTTTITVTVNDGTASTNDTFVLTVNAVNDLPTISDITDKSTNEDTATGNISFTVGDVETAAGSLNVTAISSNTTLVPNGNIALNGTGSSRTINIAPALNQNGTTTITVMVSDGTGSTSDTFVLTVNAINDLPTISNITDKSTNEDTSTGDIAFTVGDVETPLASLTVTASSSNTALVPNGNITLAGSGSSRTLNIMPASNQSGTTTITVTVNDGDTGIASDTFVLTVVSVNDPPTISDITDKSTNEDTATGNIAFTVGDVETPASLTVTATSSNTTLVPNGNITLAGNGSSRTINLAPASNQSGTTTITVNVSDGTGTVSDTFVLTVTAVNDAPVAVGDAYATAEDTTLNISAPGVLANDTDVDGNPLTAIKVSDPAHGTLTLNANGSFTYVPAALFNGTDSFTYKANDATIDSNVVIVTINVSSINNLPVAVDDTFAATEDTAKVLPATGAGSPAANDADLDLDTLTVTAVSSPVGGTVNLASGSITFTPTANLCGAGAGKFNYTVSDGNGGTDAGLVTLNIACVNDAPIANAQSVNATEDTPRAITLSGSDIDGDGLTYTVTVNPTHGTLSGTAPNLTYTPDANYNGPDSFSFKVNDTTVDSAPAVVTITVTAVNDAPVANPQSVSTNEDTAKAITLTGSDVDAGATLTFTVVTQPANGTLSGSAPNVTYTPNANFNGSDSFTFRVSDGTLNSNTATISITVDAVNDAPVANNQSVTTNEDTAKAITLTGSDVDAGTTLVYTVLTQPTNGTLNGTAPNLTYTPNLNFNGSDSFTFRVSDGTANSNTATVTITVTPVNDVPVANDQSVNTNEDTAKAITLTGSDVDTGTILTYAIVAQPAHGTLSGTAPNVTYTPAANYNGSDSFTFKVNDNTVDSAIATVTITITVVNDTPVANPQSVSTSEDTAKAITLTGSDVDTGTTLTYSIVSGPAHGALAGSAPNVTYTPAADYNGSDSFTFKVNDGTVDGNTATVTITVTAVNDTPVANDQSVSTNEDTAKAITLTASDVDAGTTLTYMIVAQPANGVLSGSTPNVTYTPNANFNGSDSFTFRVSDGTANSNTATVSITVSAVNDIPVADPQSVSTNEDTAKAITLTGSDVENSVSFAIVTGPAHGTLTGTIPTLTYTPAANYFGTDSFTFKVNDGTVDSATATVNITIVSVNDTPVANAQSVSTNEDTAKAITLTGSDVETITLTFSIVTGPAHGTLTGTAPAMTYTPAANYYGADSFTFKVNDEIVDSAPATVSITVTAVNDAPVAVGNVYATPEDTALTVAAPGILANDTDVEGDALTAIKVGNPTNGSLTFNANGSFTYTPNPLFNGTDSFTYKANDGLLDSNTVTVTINVSSVNNAPVCSPVSLTTAEDTNGQANPSCTDADGNSLEYSIVAQPGHGTATVVAGKLVYAPAANYNGPDTFTYKANDGTVDSNDATVTVTVTAVNDVPVADAQSVTTNEDTVKTITLTGSDVENAVTFALVAGPTHGTLTGTAPSVTYTPNANFTGSDSFTFRVNDGTVNSNTATVTITVTAVNDVPVANDQSTTTNEDTAKAITLTGSDVENAVTFSIVSGPTHGTLSGTAPSVTYTPAANYSGPDSFTFKVNDGTADSNIATVTITVTPVNDVPVANSQSASTNEDTSKAITLTGSDVESAVTFSIVAGPLHGTLTGSAPNVTYTPTANYYGPDSFTFKVNDGTVDSNIATVTITVTSVNDVPVANSQSVSTNEDTAKAITLTGSDLENAVSFAIVIGPSHGTLSGTAPSVTYTPAANYIGPDSFTFKVNDGTVDSNTATVTVTVNAINDAPVAVGEAYSTPEDTTLNIVAPGVLGNDTDVEGTALTAIKVTNPLHGTLTFNANGSFTYVPVTSYNGADSFTYKANDGLLDSNVVTVTINVSSVNNAPVANDQAVTTNEDTSKAITLTGSDVDAGTTLTYTVLTQPSSGTLSGSAPNVTYTPNLNFNGSDSFTFRVSDGLLNSNTATVTITVTPVNDAPVANVQSVTTNEDTAKAITLTGSDVDAGTTLIFTVLTQPSDGTLSGTAPNVAYTPNLNFNGSDSFTFRVSDGLLNSNTATVTITVTPVNDAPTANGQSVTTNEDTAKAITLTGADVDTGTTLTFTILTQPANGTLTGTAPNVTYTPNLNFNGSNSFTFRVSDGFLNSNTATVSITVTPVNDAPIANAQSVTANEDTAKAITLTGSDVDAGTTLTYTVVSQPTNGTLSGTAPNVTYTPNANFNGSDSFTFRVNDGTLNSGTATISITVTSVNDAPVANNQTVTTNEDVAKAITLTGSDLDAGTTLNFSILTQPANGTLSGAAPNVTYTPNLNFNGSDSFTFRVSDGTLNSNTATVTITVTAVNDAPVANVQSVTTNEDMAKAITLTGSDVENGTLAFSIVAQPAHGTLTGTPPNVTYTPAAHYFGPDSFTFKVNDGALDSTTATVSITAVPNEYTLMVTTVGNGSVTKTPAKATYHYGEVVQLSAVPDAGWQFSAWSGDLTGSTNPQSITLTGNKSVTATFIQASMPKPGTPLLLSPANGSATLNTLPWFDWSNSNPAAHHYRIQVALTPFFVLPVIDQTDLLVSEFTPTAELMPGVVYFWRVQAFNDTGEASNWSQVWYFRLIPAKPGLIAPANNEHILSLRPDFDWSNVTGITYYTIQVSKNSSFTQIVMSDVSLSSAFTTRKDLPAAKTLYWRVRAESFAGAGAWSETWSFTTPNPPGVPTLLSPKYGTVTSNTQPSFKWSKVGVPAGTYFDHYQIQIATEPSFDLPVFDVDISGVNSTSYVPLVPLTPNTKYFWHVRAANTDGDVSSWSSTWMFQTPRPKPPRWHTGTFSTSGTYVSWESNYSVDETLSVPTLASPAGSLLNWNDVPNVTGYIIQVAAEPTFASAPLFASATTMDSEYVLIENMKSGTTLYWRVLTISGEFISNWSPVSSFQVP